MGTETIIEDVMTELGDPETFDVLEFVNGSATPVREVVVYTNADAVLKLGTIFNKEEARTQAVKDGEVLSLADDYEVTDEDEVNALYEELTKTALTFHLKGLAPKVIDAMEKHLRATHDYKEGKENEAYNEAVNMELIARSITSVDRADGTTNSNPWTAEMADDLAVSLYPTELQKLFNAVAEVTYIGNAFHQVAKTDFLSRR